MNFCAHIFVGKEFSNIVPIIAEHILYTGGDFASCVNLFVLEENDVVSYAIPSVSDVDIIKRNIEHIGNQIGNVDVTNVETTSKFFKENIYDRILYGGNAELLHIQIHVPLYKAEAVKNAIALYDSIALLKQPKKIDIVCYADDLAGVIESSYKITTPSKKQVELLKSFKAERKLGVAPHIVLFQNSGQSGISLGLDIQTWAEVVSEYIVGCAEQYDALFPSTLQYKDIMAFGFMKLSLDKYMFVNYLVHKSLVGSMDQVEVNQENIDINKAWKIANKIIDNKSGLLSTIHETIDNKIGKDEGILNYQQDIEKSVSEILNECKKTFEFNKEITLRAAILAAMLNKTECELFSNTIFNNGLTNINDLYNESINYFVQNNTEDFYTINDEPIVNPVKELKNVTSQLINAESQIKYLTEQLQELDDSIADAKKVNECFVENDNFVFNGQHFRLLPKVRQEPLVETYEAHDGLPESVDLKEYFNNIKNQGSQGSCLSYAVTSVYEYVLKRNAQKEFDLSEAFLYYNARLMNKDDDSSVNEDKGTCFKDALDSLSKYGIALERLCPYNENVCNQKPSKEAYDDASRRKLLVAKNVNRNVSDIKSAIADGYPVAGGFGLMNSFFQSTSGDIPMPTEEDIASDNGEERHSHHAMVIVGYSDKLQHFVVRNSWGKDWGDRGYCYLPYEYVENDALCDFCCIITEVEQLDIPHLDVVPSLKLDDSDLRIRRMITMAALKAEREVVEELRKNRDSLRLYLEQEKKLLSVPNLKDEFTSSTERSVGKKLEEINEKKRSKDDEMDQLAEDYKKAKIKYFLALGCSVVGWTTLFFGFNKLLEFSQRSDSLLPSDIKNWLNSIEWSLPLWLYFAVFFAGAVYFVVRAIREHGEWKIQRDNLNREINQIRDEFNRLKLYIEKFKIRTDVAWILIRTLESVESKLQSMYANMLSLINNLRVWYKESESYVADSKNKSAEYVPVISLLDYSVLDDYYEAEIKNSSVMSIDFCIGVENHCIDAVYLREYKEQLLTSVVNKIINLPSLRNFNISEHVTSITANAVGLPVSRELLDRLNKMSDIFLHVESAEQGVIIPSVTVFANSLGTYQNKLISKFERFDANLVESSLKYELIMVKSAALSYKECAIFK